MSHPSTPEFTTFHALRIKGFATIETLVDMVGLDADTVQGHLDEFAAAGQAQFREARSLWQLTPDGRAAHADQLVADLGDVDAPAALGSAYERFLVSNGEFKELCSAWQVRNGEPNDHSDGDYDADVLSRLGAVHERTTPIVDEMGGVLDRLSPYGDRLTASLDRLNAGQTNMFTGVMCGSYHDVWMELHEDLILTQGIDRSAEGSF